jgi:isoaspartyl peptidase/L-asparaginase-like protein (Ntn-hydrolase superfamily)
VKRLDTPRNSNVLETVDLEVVSSFSNVVRDPARYRTNDKRQTTRDAIAMIAADAQGNLCAGRSTSGQAFKIKRRVGEVPTSDRRQRQEPTMLPASLQRSHQE